MYYFTCNFYFLPLCRNIFRKLGINRQNITFTGFLPNIGGAYVIIKQGLRKLGIVLERDGLLINV